MHASYVTCLQVKPGKGVLQRSFVLKQVSCVDDATGAALAADDDDLLEPNDDDNDADDDDDDGDDVRHKANK
eukprot:3651799-Amphidinium_carterae.1